MSAVSNIAQPICYQSADHAWHVALTWQDDAAPGGAATYAYAGPSNPVDANWCAQNFGSKPVAVAVQSPSPQPAVLPRTGASSDWVFILAALGGLIVGYKSWRSC